MSKPGEISTAEAKSIRVGKFMHGKFDFLVDVESLQDTFWVEAYVLVPEIWNFLWLFKWEVPTKQVVIDVRLEKPDNWVMNVYGRPYFQKCQALGAMLAKEFTTHVHVKLVGERVGKPRYSGE